MKKIIVLMFAVLLFVGSAFASDDKTKACIKKPEMSVTLLEFKDLPPIDRLPAWIEHITLIRETKFWSGRQVTALNQSIDFLSWYVQLLRSGQVFNEQNPSHEARIKAVEKLITDNFSKDDRSIFTNIDESIARKYVPVGSDKTLINNVSYSSYRPTLFKSLGTGKSMDTYDCTCVDPGWDCPYCYNCRLGPYPYDFCIPIIFCGPFKMFNCRGFCFEIPNCGEA